MVRPLLQLLVVAAIALAAASPASPGRRLDRQLARQLDALQNLLLHRTAEDPSTTAEQASEDPNTAAVRARALERRGLGVYAKARCLKWLYSLKLTANGLESQVDYVITELSTLQKDKAGYATPSRAEVLEFIAENVDFSDSTSPTSTEVKDQLLALVEAYVAAAPDTQVALELAFRKIMVESIAAAKKSMQDKQDAGGDSTLSGVAIDELDFGDTNGSKGKQVALMLLAYHKVLKVIDENSHLNTAIAIQETFALLNSFLMEKSGMDKDPKEGIKKMEAFKATESGTKYAEAEEFKNKADEFFGSAVNEMVAKLKVHIGPCIVGRTPKGSDQGLAKVNHLSVQGLLGDESQPGLFATLKTLDEVLTDVPGKLTAAGLTAESFTLDSFQEIATQVTWVEDGERFQP